MTIFIDAKDQVSSFLERNFFSCSSIRLFFACMLLSLCVFLLQNVLELSIDRLSGLFGFPSDVAGIQDIQVKVPWVSPLVFAPVFENLVCLLLLRVASSVVPGRWKAPALVAAMAALLHMVAYMDVVYASIFVNFFVICALIHNVEGSVRGFLASVLVHALTNWLVLVQLRLA
ncbi:hypothetical protein [Pseudoxanthomonas koreensis]|uniref:hypothetical protein n=1 Tax=Pseudoxanthomonas koreensis TaxID=266061 RepID=UPI00139085DF|nr:hypothetical protein [Pseudoxanthomonas koreensis]KAF1690082.1 hypothetical protein CSC64_11910 [Pseudoxanthomonas koreensis]